MIIGTTGPPFNELMTEGTTRVYTDEAARTRNDGALGCSYPQLAISVPKTVQTFWLTSVVLLSNAMLTVTTLPVDVSKSTLPVASKSPDRGESWMPLVLLVNEVFLKTWRRPKPSKTRPKMSVLPADVNAKTIGRPLESHRALISSESMLTTVLVVEFDFAMNENVLVTALVEAAALAAPAPIPASAQIEAVIAVRRRGLMIRFISRSFPRWMRQR